MADKITTQPLVTGVDPDTKRQPFPVGDAWGQLVQAVKSLPIFDKTGYSFNGTDTRWVKYHSPAVNTLATCTKNAPTVVGNKNIITQITAVCTTDATAPTSVVVIARLYAGDDIIWATTLAFPATAGIVQGINLDNLKIPIPVNTACTLKFNTAGGANTFESVSMSGYEE